MKIYPKEYNYKIGDRVKFRKLVDNDISEYFQMFTDVEFKVLKVEIHIEPEEFFSKNNSKWVETNLQRLTININLDNNSTFNEDWLMPV